MTERMAPGAQVVELSVAPDNARLANLCGAMDGNIARIARACSVEINRRGGRFRVFGEKAEAAAGAIRALYARAERGLGARDVQLCLAETMGADAEEYGDSYGEENGEEYPGARGGKNGRASLFEPLGENQKLFLEKIRGNAVAVATGPAGTGKTHIALVGALQAQRRGVVERITLTRPAVEAAGEKLGFLPGDMESKVHPYLRPLHDILRALLGRREAERRLQQNEIEVMPLAFMRGLTLERTVTILDEAQNATIGQVKMLLTRLGRNGKMILTGDETQSDLPPGALSGLSDAMRRLSHIRGIACHIFDEGDIVRHPLVRDILAAYNNNDGAANMREKKSGAEKARAE